MYFVFVVVEISLDNNFYKQIFLVIKRTFLMKFRCVMVDESKFSCAICGDEKQENDYSRLGLKGLITIIDSLRERNLKIPNLNVGDTVHVSCCKDVTNKKSLERRSLDHSSDAIKMPRKSVCVRAREHT